MEKPGFIGTFDPLHGAHIGQLLRAHRMKPFREVYIAVDKHPAHKPNASSWQHRLNMAHLTLQAYDPPFSYTILPVENSMADELVTKIDYKITGIDSLLENLQDKSRWALAQRWHMQVLSIPGESEADLIDALASLPPDVRNSISYEYVSLDDVPLMNYDFETQTFIQRRIHATNIRAGKDASLMPQSIHDYVREHNLY
jgi:nicotinic acid mononucleotide adenylyltransferase